MGPSCVTHAISIVRWVRRNGDQEHFLLGETQSKGVAHGDVSTWARTEAVPMVTSCERTSMTHERSRILAGDRSESVPVSAVVAEAPGEDPARRANHLGGRRYSAAVKHDA